MKKILSIIAGCLLAGSSYACGIVRSEIKVTGVIDGDTLRAEISGLPDELKKVSIRIAGIDAPEIRGKCGLEKEKARASKEFLTKKLAEARTVFLLEQWSGINTAEEYLPMFI